MNKTTFQNTLEFDLGIEFNERIKNLNGSAFFFEILTANVNKAFRNKNNEFKVLTKERYQNFLDLKSKRILAQGEKFTLYRVAGNLFINRFIKHNWEAAKIY